jgi:hypothetical protein
VDGTLWMSGRPAHSPPVRAVKGPGDGHDRPVPVHHPSIRAALVDPAAVDLLRRTATRAAAGAELLRLRTSALVRAAGGLRWTSPAAAMFHRELADLLHALAASARMLDLLVTAIEHHLALLVGS